MNRLLLVVMAVLALALCGMAKANYQYESGLDDRHDRARNDRRYCDDRPFDRDWYDLRRFDDGSRDDRRYFDDWWFERGQDDYRWFDEWRFQRDRNDLRYFDDHPFKRDLGDLRYFNTGVTA